MKKIRRSKVWKSSGQGSGGGSGTGAGDGGEGSGGTGGDGGSGGGAGGSGERTLTQAEVTRIATREKQEGNSAGRAALLKELGIDDPKKAKEMIEAQKKAEEQNLSETEKAKKEAEEDRAEAKRLKEEGQRETLNSRIERRLLRDGLSLPKDEDKADKALSRAVRLIDLDLDADQDAVKAAVAELKDEMPQLFAETDDDEEGNEQERRTTTRGGNDPGRPSRKGKSQGSSKDRAQARLRERHPELSDKK